MLFFVVVVLVVFFFYNITITRFAESIASPRIDDKAPSRLMIWVLALGEFVIFNFIIFNSIICNLKMYFV